MESRTMQSSGLRLMLLVLAVFTPMASAAQGGLRKGEASPTAMAGLEGEACGAEEYARYKTIVCTVVDACSCADAQCALTWCSDYVHDWKKEFGACLLKGC